MAGPNRILFCCDKGLAVGLHIALFSMLKRLQPDQPIEIHLDLEGFAEPDLEALRETIRLSGTRYPVEFSSHPLPRFLENCLEIRGSKYAYARLFAPRRFGSGRVLYLDSDLLINMDVAPMLAVDLGAHAYAARQNGTAKSLSDRRLLVDILQYDPETPTFNSGVMVIDCQRWIDTDMDRKLEEVLVQHGAHLTNFDQTALNVVARGEFAKLEPHTNVHARMPRSWMIPQQGPAIWHFMGAPKPWHFAAGLVNGYSREVFQVLDQTALRGWRPWKRWEEVQRARRLWRYYARHLVNTFKKAG